MQIEGLIPLIVGAAAVVIALVALVTALLARGGATRLGHALEAMRQEDSRTESSEGMKNLELEASLKVLHRCCDRIAVLRSSIARAESGRGVDADGETLSETGRQLSKTIEETLQRVSATEQAILKRVRDVALEAASREEAARSGGEHDRAILRRSRDELFELQRQLRDAMMDRLIRRVIAAGPASTAADRPAKP